MIEPTQIPRLVVEPLTVATTETQLSVVAGWHHDECRRRGIRSSLARRTEQLRAHLDSFPIPVTLLARKGPEPLGCVSLVRYQASAGGSDRVWLSNLYVRADARRRGLGSLLVDRACRYAREQGETELWLFTDNRQVFYKKRGWQLGGEARVSGSDVEILVRRL
ncbi:GNAT family N-acetyltransferase [Marinimicrobium sp. C2-29]|uniref:GNAT family N-acetyltransferase n=1 Tax=Marinimicrobium sp. C2-29 TaxID=3139825 RepID=UPI0031388116